MTDPQPDMTLLQLTRHVDPELALGIARRLGDNLIEMAARDADGWSWPTMRNSRLLTRGRLLPTCSGNRCFKKPRSTSSLGKRR